MPHLFSFEASSISVKRRKRFCGRSITISQPGHCKQVLVPVSWPLALTLKSNLDKFIDWEETIQNTALKSRKGVSTRDFLRLRLSAPRQTVQIFWARPTEEFTEIQSQTNYISIGDDLQSLSFTLPKGIYPPIGLRVDPGTEKGVFSIQSIRVQWLENNSSTCLQTLHPNDSSDRKLLTFQNIRHHPADPEQLFCALTQDPFYLLASAREFLLPRRRLYPYRNGSQLAQAPQLDDHGSSPFQNTLTILGLQNPYFHFDAFAHFPLSSTAGVPTVKTLVRS